MRRLIAVSIVAFPAACQAVTGNVSVGVSTSDGGVDSTASGGDAASDQVESASDAMTDVAETGTLDAPGLDAPSDVLVDAVTEAEAGPVCLTDLSNVGTGDFHVSFTITTTTSNTVLDLLNQGTVCEGSSSAWDVAVGPNGAVEGSTFDGTSIVSLHTTTAVNDGAPHHVVYARTSGVLWASTDGVADNSSVPDDSDLTEMPALQVGAGDPCTTTPLSGHGTLTDVCITAP
jgi:hypothetical protein